MNSASEDAEVRVRLIGVDFKNSTPCGAGRSLILGMQDEFNFGLDGASAGLARWRAEQKAWQVQFAKNNGLPIGRDCRVVLKNDMELVGKLETADHELPLDASRKPDLNLRVGRCNFKASEIASVVRVD